MKMAPKGCFKNLFFLASVDQWHYKGLTVYFLIYQDAVLKDKIKREMALHGTSISHIRFRERLFPFILCFLYQCIFCPVFGKSALQENQR